MSIVWRILLLISVGFIFIRGLALQNVFRNVGTNTLLYTNMAGDKLRIIKEDGGPQQHASMQQMRTRHLSVPTARARQTKIKSL